MGGLDSKHPWRGQSCSRGRQITKFRDSPFFNGHLRDEKMTEHRNEINQIYPTHATEIAPPTEHERIFPTPPASTKAHTPIASNKVDTSRRPDVYPESPTSPSRMISIVSTTKMHMTALAAPSSEQVEAESPHSVGGCVLQDTHNSSPKVSPISPLVSPVGHVSDLRDYQASRVSKTSPPLPEQRQQFSVTSHTEPGTISDDTPSSSQQRKQPKVGRSRELSAHSHGYSHGRRRDTAPRAKYVYCWTWSCVSSQNLSWRYRAD